MIKELFVSSTPHETKVGITEDDLLAEIYLERENEYTLAGSIYKGRVTRVLPGMQSAFVDIGLERDAFLYVSDFMELEDQDDVDVLPTNGNNGHTEQPKFERQAQPEDASGERNPSNGSAAAAGTEDVASAETSRHTEPRHTEAREGRGDWRGRRRRRGRRGERGPVDSKSSRTEQPRETRRPEPQAAADTPSERYEPILLPGESISKYRRYAQANQPRAASSQSSQSPGSSAESAPALAARFPEDEPLFASVEPETAASAPDVLPETFAGRNAVPAEEEDLSEESTVGSERWDREQKRLHDMNVAAVFGNDAVADLQARHSEARNSARNLTNDGEDEDDFNAESVSGEPETHGFHALEEEEIEEDETDISPYVEAAEDLDFEEMEEQVHAVDDSHESDDGGSAAHDIAASHGHTEEDHTEEIEAFSAEPVSPEEAEVAEAEETVEEESEEESELEEAQAEAEALLEAEARGEGTVDAQAEVRGPSRTAAYTQRTKRAGQDRRPQRGRRGGGGARRFRRREPQNVPLISDLLKEGQEILVQIAKEPIGKKGARITSHIALPGRFLVYMPTVNHTGVSRKIASEEERQRLKRIIISERENGHGGFIVRTAAQGASEDELRADIRFLKNLWNEIRTRAENSQPPALIYHDLNVVERILRDQVTSDVSVIWVDNEQEYERILRFANRFQPALVKRVKLYSKETPLFDQFGLSEEINKALKSKVWLKSGGYIVINQTEALVAIDINTGKYVGKTARLEDTIVKTNVDAIKEIVRQIRLRDLGGIIIIDFIDMDERRNRQKVMQALEEALRADRSPSKVLQFNDFGLVAITRKRIKQSLERTIGAPCPYCQSTGFVKSVGTICNEIYVEMRKISKHLEHTDVMLRVNPEVAKALKSSNGRLMNEMEEMTQKTVIVKSDPALHQEQFDIN